MVAKQDFYKGILICELLKMFIIIKLNLKILYVDFLFKLFSKKLSKNWE